MKKASRGKGEMRDRYDFRGGVRGKYAARYTEGTNVVVLDPDVAEMFPDGESVNEALRAVGKVVQMRERRRSKPNKRMHLNASQRASSSRTRSKDAGSRR